VPTLADHAGLTSNQYICKLRNGLRFLVRAGTDDSRVLFEIYVRKCYDAAALNSGATVIDIGANIGCYSLLAARTVARVIACEPHPENLSILSKNIELNNMTNVEIVPKAISGKAGKASLIIPDNDTFSGRYSLYPGRGERSIEVTLITLEDLIREANLNEIDVLKIDCQGSEYEILYGNAGVLSKVQQIIVECEIFPDNIHWSQGELEIFLRDLGFDVVSEANLLYASRKEISNQQ
jgi:FkbM family methyltransferase